MNHSDFEILLSAYLDDEASGDERAQVERLLVENAEFRRLHRELVALRQRLQGLPKAKLDADFARRVVTLARQRAAETERTNGNERTQGNTVAAAAKAATPNASESKSANLNPIKHAGPAKHAGHGDDAPTPAAISIPNNRKMPGWYWQMSAAAAAIGLLVVIPIVLKKPNAPELGFNAKTADAVPAPMGRAPRVEAGVSIEDYAQNVPDGYSNNGEAGGGGEPAGAASSTLEAMTSDAGQLGDLVKVPSSEDKLAEGEPYQFRAPSIDEALYDMVRYAEAHEGDTDHKRQLRSFANAPSDRLELRDSTDQEHLNQEHLIEEGVNEQPSKADADEGKPQVKEYLKDTLAKNRAVSDEKGLEQQVQRSAQRGVVVWMAKPLADGAKVAMLQRDNVRRKQSVSNQTMDDATFQKEVGKKDAGEKADGDVTSETSVANENQLAGTADSKRESKSKEAETGPATDFVPPDQSAAFSLDTLTANDEYTDATKQTPDVKAHFRLYGEPQEASILLVDVASPEGRLWVERFQSEFDVTPYVLEKPDSAERDGLQRNDTEWSLGVESFGAVLKTENDSRSGLAAGQADSARQVESAQKEGERKDQKEATSRSRTATDRFGNQSIPSPATEEPAPSPAADKMFEEEVTDERAEPKSEAEAKAIDKNGGATNNGKKSNAEKSPSRGDSADLSKKAKADSDTSTEANADAEVNAPVDSVAKKLAATNGQAAPEFGFGGGSRYTADGHPYVQEFRWLRRTLSEEARQPEVASAPMTLAFDAPASGLEMSGELKAGLGTAGGDKSRLDKSNRVKWSDQNNNDDKKEADKNAKASGASSAPIPSKKISRQKAPAQDFQELAESSPDSSAPEGQARGKLESLAGKPAAASPSPAKSDLRKADAPKPEMPKPAVDDDRPARPAPAAPTPSAPGAAGKPAPAAAGGPAPAPPASRPSDPDPRNAPAREPEGRQSGEKSPAGKGSKPAEDTSKEVMQKSERAGVAGKSSTLEREAAPTTRTDEKNKEEMAKDENEGLRLSRYGRGAATRPRWLVIIVPKSGQQSADLLGRESAKANASIEAGTESHEAAGSKAEPAGPATPEPVPASQK